MPTNVNYPEFTAGSTCFIVKKSDYFYKDLYLVCHCFILQLCLHLPLNKRSKTKTRHSQCSLTVAHFKATINTRIVSIKSSTFPLQCITSAVVPVPEMLPVTVENFIVV